jgi:hypothetical protein
MHVHAAPAVEAMNQTLHQPMLMTGLRDRLVNHSPNLLPGMPASKTARKTRPTKYWHMHIRTRVRGVVVVRGF